MFKVFLNFWKRVQLFLLELNTYNHIIVILSSRNKNNFKSNISQKTMLYFFKYLPKFLIWKKVLMQEGNFKEGESHSVSNNSAQMTIF